MRKVLEVVATFAVMLFLWTELAAGTFMAFTRFHSLMALAVVALATFVLCFGDSSRKASKAIRSRLGQFMSRNHYGMSGRIGFTAPFAFGSGGGSVIRFAF